MDLDEKHRPGTLKYLLIAAIIMAALMLVLTGMLLLGIHNNPYEMNELHVISEFLCLLREYEQRYKDKHGRFGTLEELLSEGIMREEYARATTPDKAICGYYWNLKLTEDGFECIVLPAEPGKTGIKSFYMDQEMTIRCAPYESSEDTPAGPDSPELGGAASPR